MQFGSFEIFLLTDGLFELGRHFMRELGGGGNPQAEKPAFGRKKRLLVAINPVLIRSGERLILCDTGIGTQHRERPCPLPPAGAPSPVVKQLAALGFSPEDVTDIILTHLHYDHAGGLTCLDGDLNPAPVYPNARIFVQADEWEAAQKALYQPESAYRTENWGVYQESPALYLLDGGEEILPGIRVVKTGGHTAGHQVILIDGGDGRKAAFPGDLIPTPAHFSPGLKMKFDDSPDRAKEWRRRLVEQTLRENRLLFFYHAPVVRAGYPYKKTGAAIKVRKADIPVTAI